MEKKLDKILYKVEKPVRYMGNELNMVYKDVDQVDVRFAFAFPDLYEIGMSHLGIKILYHLLNSREDCFCERVFAPWTDMEEQMRYNDIPLFTLETKSPLKEFDIVGFTLQYELSYTNVLNMLDLAGIPLLSTERQDDDPLIIAGGPCVYNSEPVADFFDLIVIGDSEEVLPDIIDLYKVHKNKWNRIRFLEEACKLRGVYVPSFYTVSYKDDNTIKSVLPIKSSIPPLIVKNIVSDLNNAYYPDKFIVPFTDIVHDRITLEIFRGCTRGCRFCQAGMLYRPVRERSVDKLIELCDKLEESTGYEELSLASLSSGDYPYLEELVVKLIKRYEDRKVSISLPSLRIDSLSKQFLEEIKKIRKTGLTLAPEAGTQRLRDVINKGVTEEDLVNSVNIAFQSGWEHVKLYFMMGLPTETYEDLDGIAELAKGVKREYFKLDRDSRPRRFKLIVSTSSFVPKAFTPFQWEAQDTIDELEEKQSYLKKQLKIKGIQYNYHDSKTSFLEAVFARGDRKLSSVLLSAWKKGCKFDGWNQHFKYTTWMQAFSEEGIDPNFYSTRKRDLAEVFPWDHIDAGVSKEFLKKEYFKAYKNELTHDCREGCVGCGLTRLGDKICP